MQTSAFNIPIYNTSLTFNCEKLNEYCYSMKSKLNGRRVSNTGWQCVIKEHLDIEKDINDYINEFASNIGFKKTQKVNQMWVNINGNKDFNMPHVHLNSHFSGVFYSKLPKNSGKLVFQNPYEGIYYLWDNLEKKNTTADNAFTYEITPREKELYIFPSWLRHYVEANLSDEDRISISFDSIGV